MNKKTFLIAALVLTTAQAHAGWWPFPVRPKKPQNFCREIKAVDRLRDRTRESVQRLRAEGFIVDRVVVSKDRRELYVISGETLLRRFAVAFGDPRGPKRFEGDRKTPDGVYKIISRNPKSKFHLSLKISYPNQQDRDYARRHGKSPGGDIMIHGLPNPNRYSDIIYGIHPDDWTNGCIAVTNEEIREVWALVGDGTDVEICPLTELETQPSKRR